jgi:hypothetical protein
MVASVVVGLASPARAFDEGPCCTATCECTHFFAGVPVEVEAIPMDCGCAIGGGVAEPPPCFVACSDACPFATDDADRPLQSWQVVDTVCDPAPIGEVLSFAASPRSLDRVSAGDNAAVPDGFADGVFDLDVTGPVKNIRLAIATDASGVPFDGVQWDTYDLFVRIPLGMDAGFTIGTQTWVLGVEENGVFLNPAPAGFGGIPQLSDGRHLLRLYAAFADWFEANRFRVDVEFADGSIASGIVTAMNAKDESIDRVAPGDGGLAPDGLADGVFDLTVTGRIDDVRLAVADFEGHVFEGTQWDTFQCDTPIPPAVSAGYTTGAQTWVLGVEVDGAPLAGVGCDYDVSSGPGVHHLRLFAPWADWFADWGYLFRVDVVLEDGSIVGTTMGLDECVTHPCDAAASCTDSLFAYRCACEDELVGDGLSCAAACDPACFTATCDCIQFEGGVPVAIDSTVMDCGCAIGGGVAEPPPCFEECESSCPFLADDSGVLQSWQVRDTECRLPATE